MSLARDFLTEIATLTPTQTELVRSVQEYEYTLYGGTAGPGKTHTEVATAAWLSFMNGVHGVEASGAFLSSDKKRIVERFMTPINNLLVKPGLGQVFGATEKEPGGFRFYNRQIPPIYFVGLYELSSLKGRQLAFAAWDEVTESEEEAFHEVDWRVRFSSPNKWLAHEPIFGATNPDGVGNYWVYEYFVNKTFNTPLGENFREDLENSQAKFNFIPANLEDNPDKEFRESYRRKLERQPTHLRDARLHGIWTSGQGARFPYAPNVIRWSDLPGSKIPDNWERFLGIDWGFGLDPCKVFWIAFDELRNAYVYRSMSLSGYGIEAAARSVRERNGGEPYRAFGSDPTMFARDPKELRGLNTYFEAEGLVLWKSTNSHEITNALIEKYMDPENGHPNLYFIEGATDTLIPDLRAVRFNPEDKQPENLIPHVHTHTVYALGYGLHAAWPNTQEVDPYTPAEHARRDRIERMIRRAYSNRGSILSGL